MPKPKTGTTHYHALSGQRSCNKRVGCLLDVIPQEVKIQIYQGSVLYGLKKGKPEGGGGRT